jgi:hypothetical protein
MKKYVLICVTLLSLYGFSAAKWKEKSMENETVQSIVQSNVVLSVTLPKVSIAGERVNIELSLENKGEEDILYASISKYRDYELQVYDEKKKEVPMTRFGTLAIGADHGERWKFNQKKLASNKRLSSVVDLARLFDLTLPGEYTLNVKRVVNENLLGKEMALEVKGVLFTISEAP